jgi:hypothetical protein
VAFSFLKEPEAATGLIEAIPIAAGAEEPAGTISAETVTPEPVSVEGVRIRGGGHPVAGTATREQIYKESFGSS